MQKLDYNNFIIDKSSANLYELVKDMPIVDYHCHLDPQAIYEDKVFYNLTELWLIDDHYKWRIMRNFGIHEDFITGNADPYQKFIKLAEALPNFVGNPVYHWIHLELYTYFGISTILCPKSANDIWNKTIKMMSDGSFSARKLIEISKVEYVITTDNPNDNLDYHKKLSNEKLNFNVLPCFRLDNYFNIDSYNYSKNIKLLEEKSRITITNFESLIFAIAERLNYFKENKCVSIDCSMIDFPYESDNLNLDDIIKKINSDQKLTTSEIEHFKFNFLVKIIKLAEQNNMVMQLHLGVLRNNNSKLYKLLGNDCGCDSIGNAINIENGNKLLDRVSRENNLPKMIIYTLNPSSYYPIATMLGNFAGVSKGRLQLGAGWWFLDTKEGIKQQLKVFAQTSGIGLFLGMLTDSRSFSSYVRHNYFRRIICKVFSNWISDGEMSGDIESVKTLLTNICYNNAKSFFDLK